MDQIAYVHLTVEKEGRKYMFMMPIGAPLGEAYDACFEALGEIIKISKEAADRAKPKDKEESVKEDS